MGEEFIKKIIKKFDESLLEHLEYKDSEVTLKMSKECGLDEKDYSVENEITCECETHNESIIMSKYVGFIQMDNLDKRDLSRNSFQVKKGEILCYINILDVLMEIRSEVTGYVEEIFIKNGEQVEFGTKLFKIIY